MQKLKKYILAFSIMTIISLLHVNMIFAVEVPTYYISETINKDGTLTATVSFTDNSAAAGTINLSYNTDKLTLSSSEKGTAKVQMITINDKQQGMVSVNFLNTKGEVKGDTNLVVLNFEVGSNDIEQEDIFSESFKLYNINSQLVSDSQSSDLIYQLNTESAPSDIFSTNRQKSQTSKAVSDISKASRENNKIDTDPEASRHEGNIQSHSYSDTAENDDNSMDFSLEFDESNSVKFAESTNGQLVNENTEQQISVPNSEVLDSASEDNMVSNSVPTEKYSETSNILWLSIAAVVIIISCIAIFIVKKQKSH